MTMATNEWIIVLGLRGPTIEKFANDHYGLCDQFAASSRVQDVTDDCMHSEQRLVRSGCRGLLLSLTWA